MYGCFWYYEQMKVELCMELFEKPEVHWNAIEEGLLENNSAGWNEMVKSRYAQALLKKLVLHRSTLATPALLTCLTQLDVLTQLVSSTLTLYI